MLQVAEGRLLAPGVKERSRKSDFLLETRIVSEVAPGSRAKLLMGGMLCVLETSKLVPFLQNCTRRSATRLHKTRIGFNNDAGISSPRAFGERPLTSSISDLFVTNLSLFMVQ